jgi:hypothetical protein
MGHQVLRIEHLDHGGSLLVFEPSAKTTLDQFIAFKEDADAMIAEADSLR